MIKVHKGKLILIKTARRLYCSKVVFYQEEKEVEHVGVSISLILVGTLLFLKEERKTNNLLKAVATYKHIFKLGTMAYIFFMAIVMVPLQTVFMLVTYAVMYLYASIIMYGLYKNQPMKVFFIVVILHLLGLSGRIALEWMEWTPMKLFNIVLPLTMIPLYMYIVQLILTLSHFSKD